MVVTPFLRLTRHAVNSLAILLMDQIQWSAIKNRQKNPYPRSAVEPRFKLSLPWQAPNALFTQ